MSRKKSISRNNGCKHTKFDEKYYLHIQESQQTPSRINKKKSTDIIKLQKPKDRESLESNMRKMKHHIQGNPNKINSWLLIRKDGGGNGITFKMLKEKNNVEAYTQ